MKLLIAGATGFIGQALVSHFSSNNSSVTVLGRSVDRIQQQFGDTASAIDWDSLTLEDIEKHDAIINLCGAGVADKRWTPKRKEVLLNSRVNPQITLATLCAQSHNKPDLISASGIGTYGLQASMSTQLPEPMDEHTPVNYDSEPDFMATLGRRREKAANVALEAGVRVVHLRLGAVLGPGAMVKKLKPLYQLGLGGPIGSGHQPFSWIALPDVVNSIDFLLQHKAITGPVNLVAPHAVMQRDFAITFAHILNRPAIVPMPSMVAKLLFGQMADELLLNGQHIKPSVLIENGYSFQYPELEDALRAALS